MDLTYKFLRANPDYTFGPTGPKQQMAVTFMLGEQGPYTVRVDAGDDWELRAREEIEKLRRKIEAISV